MKETALVTGDFYHVCTKSIAGYKIFNDDQEFSRMKEAFRFLKFSDTSIPLSQRLNAEPSKLEQLTATMRTQGKMVSVLAYCIMPTHLHLLLRQRQKAGISRFMSRILNSYAKFFNLKHGRKGPLWEGRFERIRIENDSHLLHETRYIHLNPVTAYLSEDPKDWQYSSYREYLSDPVPDQDLCEFRDAIDVKPDFYESFVLAGKEDLRRLASLKKKNLQPLKFNLRG